MGGTGGERGVTLQFFDPSGNPDPTRKSVTHDRCWITQGDQLIPYVGSGDWIKEIYLAPNAQSLYTLMRSFPPSGRVVCFTSGSSLDVTVNYVDNDQSMKSERWKCCIGGGTDVKVTLASGKSEPLRIFDTFKLTQGDAIRDESNQLHADALEAIHALE